jgi:hypothetical protein
MRARSLSEVSTGSRRAYAFLTRSVRTTIGSEDTDTRITLAINPNGGNEPMSAKQIAFDQEAREAMKRGIAKLARAVKVTLGPKGRNVIIQKSFGSPTVTKDGVTVAKEIQLPDHYENMGAMMV